jgi:hypothetical protein
MHQSPTRQHSCMVSAHLYDQCQGARCNTADSQSNRISGPAQHSTGTLVAALAAGGVPLLTDNGLWPSPLLLVGDATLALSERVHTSNPHLMTSARQYRPQQHTAAQQPSQVVLIVSCKRPHGCLQLQPVGQWSISKTRMESTVEH